MQVIKNDWPVCVKTSNLSFLLLDAYILRQCPWDLLLRLANLPPAPPAHSKHARVPGCGIIGAFHHSVAQLTWFQIFCTCTLVCVHSFMALVGSWDSGAKPYSPRQLEVLTLLVQLDDLAIKPKMHFQFDFNWTLKLWNYSPRRIRPRGDCEPFCDGKRF